MCFYDCVLVPAPLASWIAATTEAIGLTERERGWSYVLRKQIEHHSVRYTRTIGNREAVERMSSLVKL